MHLPVYKKHKDHDKIIESAHLAISALLPLNLYEKHKRELIDVCLWKITEVDGKYKTRYRSEGALHIKDIKMLHHEHVVEKYKVIDQLLENPEKMEEILALMYGCVVTRQEHALLTSISNKNPSLHGWCRYHTAGIRVYDLQCRKLLESEV